jgi:hypothetical protein
MAVCSVRTGSHESAWLAVGMVLHSEALGWEFLPVPWWRLIQ